ncbi:MbtH family NRPS accessory protein [Kitasatospora sp. NPDC002040]|uniref:MbtH family protein n=1 Tax=Kitasatospora sp. NPDC002040 TaxID=3154661 RepID=UPI00332A648E
MSNPFENEDGQFLVLVNHENQHSLWPAGIDVPAGWDTVKAAAPRAACLAYIEENWTDLRPAGLTSGSPYAKSS